LLTGDKSSLVPSTDFMKLDDVEEPYREIWGKDVKLIVSSWSHSHVASGPSPILLPCHISSKWYKSRQHHAENTKFKKVSQLMIHSGWSLRDRARIYLY